MIQDINRLNNICKPITFNNPLKTFFLIRNIYYNPNTPDTNCKSIFLNKKTSF